MRRHLHPVIVTLVLLVASYGQPVPSLPPDFEKRIHSGGNGLTLVVLGALIGRLTNVGNSEARHLAETASCYYNPRRVSDLCPRS